VRTNEKGRNLPRICPRSRCYLDGRQPVGLLGDSSDDLLVHWGWVLMCLSIIVFNVGIFMFAWGLETSGWLVALGVVLIIQFPFAIAINGRNVEADMAAERERNFGQLL